ncbi:hypothetical protein J6590_099202 [Homalodisca vitripennis]|nr:hypothetical protein J6590_103484 [Homalodisca vitripennis]KAG8314139.1 hypothetical protein J6590_099202 [Homalodisca vitripennis]
MHKLQHQDMDFVRPLKHPYRQGPAQNILEVYDKARIIGISVKFFSAEPDYVFINVIKWKLLHTQSNIYVADLQSGLMF